MYKQTIICLSVERLLSRYTDTAGKAAGSYPMLRLQLLGQYSRTFFPHQSLILRNNVH